MHTRSSKGFRIALCQRFARARTYADWKAIVTSDEFAVAMAKMNPVDRIIAQGGCAEAYARCSGSKPIPPAGSTRVKAWDEAMIAKLRAAEARFGNDDDIARELKLPIKAIRSARWKYCGPRRPFKRPPSTGAAAT